MKAQFQRAGLALLVLMAGPCPAAADDRLRYLVSLGDLGRHLIEVTIEIPAGRPEREFQLPVWNALYQIRDFSQYMNWMRAENPDGRPLRILPLNKSRWKLAGTESGARLHYQMFANDPSPYGAELNHRHAFLNLAEVLCYLVDERSRAVELRLENLPAGWKVATALAPQGNGYWAPNYDQLVDSPVEIGSFAESDFRLSCGTYRVVVDGDNQAAILKKIVPTIERIVETAAGWMEDCPFENYVFIYHFPSSSPGGGMEHAYSTAITLPERSLGEDLGEFNAVTAHEFFHLWNVKRIRPQSLEPIDYTRENYTPSLWFSEGVDSAAAEYILLRAGLRAEKVYLEHLSRAITELEDRPAHFSQSAEESSLDAWLEKYPYYGLPVRSISYYNKGELLGVLLDLAMRDASDDQVSLAALFRWMNEKEAKQGRFFADSEGVRQAVETLTHGDFGEFFDKYVHGVDEIPWNHFFTRVGLEVKRREVTHAYTGFQAVRVFDQSPVVVEVEEGSAAEHAGLKTGDTILEVNGEAADRKFSEKIEELSPGATLHLVVLRQRAQQALAWKLGAQTQPIFELQELPAATAEQKARRARWLFDRTAEK